MKRQKLRVLLLGTSFVILPVCYYFRRKKDRPMDNKLVILGLLALLCFFGEAEAQNTTNSTTGIISTTSTTSGTTNSSTGITGCTNVSSCQQIIDSTQGTLNSFRTATIVLGVLGGVFVLAFIFTLIYMYTTAVPNAAYYGIGPDGRPLPPQPMFNNSSGPMGYTMNQRISHNYPHQGYV